MRFLISSLSFFILFPFLLPAQIQLENASFEGVPQDAIVPTGWHPCMEGTTPDILPGPWSVYGEPSDGEAYMGLITRNDGSYESIGQRLRQPLFANECYTFTIELSNSGTYSGYNAPAKLRIWGGSTRCSKDQLLAVTDPVKGRAWDTHRIQFFTKKEINYIILEAYFNDPSRPQNGNILIDDISVIFPCERASL